MNKDEVYVKKEIFFDLKNRYAEFKSNNNWEVVIICTKVIENNNFR